MGLLLVGFQKSDPVADWLASGGIVTETEAWPQSEWDRFKVCLGDEHSLLQCPENNLSFLEFGEE